MLVLLELGGSGLHSPSAVPADLEESVAMGNPFLETESTEKEVPSFTLAIISRRSRLRAGLHHSTLFSTHDPILPLFSPFPCPSLSSLSPLLLLSFPLCAGTRYKRRGVDSEGNVANYVETELVLKCGSHVVSYVIIRGSVPVYWSQPGNKYRPLPVIENCESAMGMC